MRQVRDSGMCSKFIPHMPLMTTKGMLSVATTDSPFVIGAEPVRDLGEVAVQGAAQQFAIGLERVVDAQHVVVHVAEVDLRPPAGAACSAGW